MLKFSTLLLIVTAASATTSDSYSGVPPLFVPMSFEVCGGTETRNIDGSGVTRIAQVSSPTGCANVRIDGRLTFSVTEGHFGSLTLESIGPGVLLGPS